MTERVGSFLVFGERRGRVPIRRLARPFELPNANYRSAIRAGETVELVDFGTHRERYARDDTWVDATIRSYLSLREGIDSREVPAPLEYGEIVPPREGASLPRGHFVPLDHLEVLPRVYAVERHLVAASSDSTAAAECLSRVAAWLRAHDAEMLGIENIEIATGRSDGGEDIAVPYLRFLPSADYAPSEDDIPMPPIAAAPRRSDVTPVRHWTTRALRST